MKRWEAWLMSVSVLVVTASGLLYGVMKYVMTGTDPDSRLGHPWQPDTLKAHVLAAPFFIFALGLVFRAHGLVRARNGETAGRKTGLAMLTVAIPTVLSGYLCQALVGDAARQWTGFVHTGISCLYGLAYLLHPRGKSKPAVTPGASTATPP